MTMKDHLKFTSNKEDALIVSYIAAAVQYAESRTWRRLGLVKVLGLLDDFPDYETLELPGAPLIEVESVEYRNGNGDMLTLDPSRYMVDSLSEPGAITIKNSWPATDGKRNAVQITYKAGYEAAIDVPVQITQAVMMLTTHFFRNRSSVVVSGGSVTVKEVPAATDALLDMYSLRVPV
jgi:uncharacterized phiE125 gp8 family phage protein